MEPSTEFAESVGNEAAEDPILSAPALAGAETGRTAPGSAVKSGKKKKKPGIGWTIFRIFRRTVLLMLLLVLFVVAAAAMACNAIFNGPSQEAREMLFYCFYEPSGTKWLPGLFMSQEQIDQIKNKTVEVPPMKEQSNPDIIQIDTSLNGENDEWKDHPDGIRIIRDIKGDTFTAHIMIIRDPSRVYLGTSVTPFDGVTSGIRIDTAMERDNAVAGINAGAFWDDGKQGERVGKVPEGLVFSKGRLVWSERETYHGTGFAGFTEDNILVVVNRYITGREAREMNIRDGCSFGPALIMDGQINTKVYNGSSGLNPRTCIAQRADGAVIFLCVDGRQASSLGASYADCIDILVEYGAVNAYNLDGGSSTAMFYRDTYGEYGEEGEIVMVNNYSLLQTSPRRMPTFFLVAPAEEDGSDG